MPHYFFDTLDGDKFIEDAEGLELPDIEAARKEATLSLAELARDVIAGANRRILIVEVREGPRPILEARLTFEAVLLPRCTTEGVVISTAPENFSRFSAPNDTHSCSR